MRVLLNDGMDDEGLEVFHNAGIETDTGKRDIGALVEEIGSFDGLVVRSATNVTREVIEAGYKGNLIIIGRAGVGYDNIDVDAASEHRIVVKYAPHGNANATAELALALMLSVSRKVPQAHYSLVNGVWRKKEFQGTELSQKTLGIIGCGRIGKRLSELVIGFNMEVVGYDPVIDPDSRIKYLKTIDDVLKRADYVSIHAAGNGKPIIGQREIDMMKPGAYLINASRGQNVDERALYDALSNRKIAGAALDVYSNEPNEGQEFTHMLKGLPNVVMTSHLGASTMEAQKKTSIEMAEAIVSYLHGNFSNAVNVGETVEAERRRTYSIIISHQDIPGAFQKISEVLAAKGINIRENPSRKIGINGASNGDVNTVYRVHQAPGKEVLSALESLPMVYRARAPQMGKY